jgi:hypothetical protein
MHAVMTRDCMWHSTAVEQSQLGPFLLDGQGKTEGRREGYGGYERQLCNFTAVAIHVVIEGCVVSGACC